MLPSRAWEFLFGAMLGIKINQLNVEKKKKQKGILAIIGFLTLLFSFALFDTSNLHPTYLTLIPVTATYLIIRDTNKDNLVNKILSFNVLIFIGLISYSFYLWHHPIFSFAKILDIGQQNIFIKVCIIFISIFFGFITYRFVEKPFRNEGERVLNIGKISILSLGTLLILICSYFSITFQKGNFPNIAQDLYQKTWFTTKQFFKPCFQRKTIFCSFNEKENYPTVFLIGDSVMASIQDGLKNQLIKKNINFITMTNAGCDFLEIDKNNKTMCNKKIFHNRLKKIKQKKGATLIIHFNYTQYNKENNIEEIEFLRVINDFLENNYNIILMYPIPYLEKNVSIEIEKNIIDKKEIFDVVNIDLKEYLDESKKTFDLFDKLKHDNLYKVYPHKKFCNTDLDKKCIGNTQNEIYFIDNTHLSKKGSDLINVDLVRIIDKIY